MSRCNSRQFVEPPHVLLLFRLSTHTAREIKTSATGSGALRAQHAMRQGSLLPGRDEVISVWLVAINNHVGPLS